MEEQLSSFARPIQNAANRETEGRQPDSASFQEKATETKRQRGRPKGSRNKSKALIPTELASQLLLEMKDVLPPDHYEYIRKVIREGAAVSVQREVQIMLLLLGRNLLPAILEETRRKDDETGEEDPYFRKDVTERLKVWNSLASILHQLEKNEPESDTREKPIAEIFARSGVDRQRIEVLVSHERSDMGRDPNGVRGAEAEAGTVSDQLPERPLDIQDSEQGATIRVLDDYRSRDDTRSVREAQL
jgi:hypothetical protein